MLSSSLKVKFVVPRLYERLGSHMVLKVACASTQESKDSSMAASQVCDLISICWCVCQVGSSFVQGSDVRHRIQHVRSWWVVACRSID